MTTWSTDGSRPRSGSIHWKESAQNKTALNTGQKTYKRDRCRERPRLKQQIDDDNLEVIEYAKKKGYDLGGVAIRWQTRIRKEEEPKPEP